MEKQRLDKFISNQLNLPRSMAKTQIHRGKVTINGEIVRDPSLVFDVGSNTVTYKGETVEYKKFVYIVMNKPKGVLCATEDKKAKTVIDLIPDELKRKNLFPVGRLDKDTTGLLIVTDDGDFAHNCISPSKCIAKTYLVTLDGELKEDMIDAFKKGITLVDGTACKPAKLEIIDKYNAKLTIIEGKYHEIKRMFGVLDLGVNELKRESIGAFRLPNDLSEGECRLLNSSELAKITEKYTN